ncbi:S8 family serine peptidase [SAR86 cluster bacterium]|nr:S8 family serine peptidase [SAR86 cluster bacterium]
MVAVIDDGLEIAHEDLVDNIVTGSYDFLNSDEDPLYEKNDGSHGNAVAGIIAAKGFNGIGVRGVAYNASLIGYNYLENSTYENQIKSWGTEPPIPVNVDIYNMSYGRGYGGEAEKYTFADYLEASLEDALIYGVENLRGGKGAIYVQSAGNGFNDYPAENSGVNCGTKLTCTSIAIDDNQSVPHIIQVSSLNANGLRSTYSTTGPSVWVAGFGGEYGTMTPAVMTTDDTGCEKGYVGGSTGSPANAFESTDGHPENPNCNYTSTFNGTSAAAPTVAGVIALMLEANPNLTWRAVKHILATTSQKVDLNQTYTQQDTVQYQWTTNAAGYSHHHWYGFGKIDGAAAVSLAQTFNSEDLGSFFTTDYTTPDETFSIPDEGTVTQTISLTKPENGSGIVEFVRVSFSFTHTIANSVGIRVQSPSGTYIPILQPYTNLASSPSNYTVDIGAAGFYGENMEGVWTVEFRDYVGDSSSGTAKWGIEVYSN